LPESGFQKQAVFSLYRLRHLEAHRSYTSFTPLLNAAMLLRYQRISVIRKVQRSYAQQKRLSQN
jgi:hypothetical protein